MELEHPDLWLKLLKVHQRELWQETARRALARQAEAATPRRPKHRLLTLRERFLRRKVRLQPTTPSPVDVKRHTACPVRTIPARTTVSTPLTCQESSPREAATEEIACCTRV